MKNIVAIVLAAAIALPAFAGEKPGSQKDDLPGVDRQASTASTNTIPPEPDDALPAGSTPGSFRAGNWDITISGSISYEIGFGNYSGR